MPKPPASNSPEHGGKQPTPTDFTTNTQGTENAGFSTAGIVIGVIAAILAVIGIAAVDAPQLGLQIPGLK